MVMMTERHFKALENWIKREADYRAAVLVGRDSQTLNQFAVGAAVAREVARRELCEEAHP